MKWLTPIRLRRLERDHRVLRDRLRKVEITTDANRIEAFADIALRYFMAGAKEHRELKVRILAVACAYCATEENTDRFDEMLQYFDAVDRLQPFHFRILQHLHAPEFITPLDNGGHRHVCRSTLLGVSKALKVRSDEVDGGLLRPLLQLQDDRLITLEQSSVQTLRKGFSVVESNPYVLLQHLPFGLTKFGCGVLRYVRDGQSDFESVGVDNCEG